jgi:hypothetical protein
MALQVVPMFLCQGIRSHRFDGSLSLVLNEVKYDLLEMYVEVLPL